MITPEAQLSIIPEKVQLKKLLKLSKIHLFAFSLWRGELGRPGEGVDDISISSEMINKVEAQVMQWDKSALHNRA